MLEFGNSIYIIDVDAFDTAITISTAKDGQQPLSDIEKKTTLNGDGTISFIEVVEKAYGKTKEIDAVKYDLLKLFIEYLMEYDEPTDDSLGVDRALAKAPLGYKIIFNTLLQQGILKEMEVE
jgi:hypothetical protein